MSTSDARPGTASEFDVETLHGRRATGKVNRLVVADILDRLTWSHPDKAALIGEPGAYGSARFARQTYAEADATANQVAHALLASGLQRSARVAMLCDNSVEAVITMFGIAKAGLVCVPLNPLFHESVTASLLRQVDASYAIVDAGLRDSAEGAFASAELQPAVIIPVGADSISGKNEGAVDFETWISDQPQTAPEVDIPLHADDIWIMLFTSGTTSTPKSVMYSNTYSYLASLSFAGTMTRGVRYEEDLLLCTYLPVIFHCGHNASIFAAFLSGGTCVLGRGFDPKAVADSVTSHRATALWAGAPRFLDAIATVAEKETDIDLTSLTVGLFAWTAMSPQVAKRLKALAPDMQLVEAFGQTEALSCYRFWLDQHPDKVESSGGATNHVGVPNPLLAGAILDADGNSLRGTVDVPGEACYRSPAVMSGYFRDPDATSHTFRGDWFHSGDSCAYEPDGTQTMVDRYKDMIKSGGENVASIRVEMVAASHPDVLRAAVIGVPDQRWGEKVVVVAEKAGASDLTPAALITFCRERLAGYESPKEVRFVDALPETVGGKVLKYKIRQQYADAT